MAGKTENRRGTGPDARPGFGATALVFLCALLIAPVLAAVRLDLFGHPFWALGIAGVNSLTAFVVQWLDKKRAERELWRVPENFLHVLELCGGWPGSFIAQRLFRHKISKLSYQVVFWLVVAGYELISVDLLLGWKMAQQAKSMLGL